MTVDALRRYFRNLAEIMQNGKGGKEVLDDLAAIDRGLTPFAALPLKSFADFLDKARDYDPDVVIGKKTTRTSGGSSKGGVDIQVIAATVKHLYDTAARPGVTIESIDQGLKVLDNLTIPNLKIVAKAIQADSGLKGNKAEMVTIVKNAVRGMWGSAQRVRQ